MAQLKRFGFAVQAIIVLASNAEQRSSTAIADQIRCEPTALRKILSQLAEASIIQVRQGRGGGYHLSKVPSEITLFEVYSSLHEEVPRLDRMLDTTGNHLFGQRMNESFLRLMQDINTEVSKVLGNYTIADLMD